MMFEGQDGEEYHQYALVVNSEQQQAQMALWSVAGKIAANYNLTIPEIIALLGSIESIYQKMLTDSLLGKLPGATGKQVGQFEAEQINEDFLNEMKQDFEDGGYFSD